MQQRWLWTAGILAVGAAGLVWSMWPEPPKQAEAGQDTGEVEREELLHPRRPGAPPVRGRDRPAPVAEPTAPEGLVALKDAAYREALAKGSERPGERAYRAMIDAFMAHNKAFAEAQAREEGVTVAEIHELTYFGFKALETQRWPEVEDVLGQPIAPEDRAAAEQLMHESNREFKDEIRRLVKEGASEEERWALIEDTQTRYMDGYYELTGMNPELVDELLAGDPSKQFAPADTPPPDPEDIEPAPPPPPIEPRPEAGR